MSPPAGKLIPSTSLPDAAPSAESADIKYGAAPLLPAEPRVRRIPPSARMERTHGEEAVRRQSGFRDDRGRPGAPLRSVRDGSIGPGHHGPRHGSLKGIRVRRNGH